LEINETRKPDAGDFTNLIEVQGHSADGSHSLVANLNAEGHARIVSIDGYNLNVEPSGNMVVLRNVDRPGIIGRVGSVGTAFFLYPDSGGMNKGAL
jgi:D-3-phosphoglycerate dehydrogenase